MAAVTFCYLIYLAVPIVLLLVGSFGAVWFNTLLPSGATLGWYAQLLGDGNFNRAFWTSLKVCALTCGAAAVAGVPLAYALHGAANRGVAAAMRILYLLPIAVPPLVLAFGAVLMFSTSAFPYLGSIWVLVGGHLALTLPYLLSALVNDMRHLGLGALERAAESLGAGLGQRFFHVVLPALRHSLLSGLIVVAALSIGEFQLSNLVAGFLTRPYPVVLLQAFYGATGFACAATVVLLALAVVAAVGGWTAARGTRAVHGISA